MVRPSSFGFNDQTAASNAFQQPLGRSTSDLAVAEFDAAVATLRSNGVEVLVAEDSAEPPKPDAVFPNNWFCASPSGSLTLFPMAAENRRSERCAEIIDAIQRRFRCDLVDLTDYEHSGQFLEGTGSLVVDWMHGVAYMCRSIRSSPLVAAEFCRRERLELVEFDAFDKRGQAIYHTNVLMAIGTEWAVICRESTRDEDIFQRLVATERTVIDISLDQVAEFAGNMLELRSATGDALIVMSSRAKRALREDQIRDLEVHGRLVELDIPTIESVGGGSARCMIAEIFLAEIRT
jgi:hypothetical protein